MRSVMATDREAAAAGITGKVTIAVMATIMVTAITTAKAISMATVTVMMTTARAAKPQTGVNIIAGLANSAIAKCGCCTAQ